MPTYQYSCTECGEPLEVVQAFTDDTLTECPECGGRLRKLYNAVGIVFKGSGLLPHRQPLRIHVDGARLVGVVERVERIHVVGERFRLELEQLVVLVGLRQLHVHLDHDPVVGQLGVRGLTCGRAARLVPDRP